MGEHGQDDSIVNDGFAPSASAAIEESMGQCRRAVLPDEHEKGWKSLEEAVSKSKCDRVLTMSNILMEFPYESMYRPYLDRFFVSCGQIVVVSCCCGLLKEISRAKEMEWALPPKEILQACWSLLQRQLLSKEEAYSLFDPTANVADLKRFSELLLTIPSIMANACHACKIQLPLLATSTKFFPRMIDCSWSRRNVHESFRIALLKTLLANRNNAEPIALGLAAHHPLPVSWTDWSSRELNNLILALMQHCVVDPSHKEEELKTCQQLIQSSSEECQEALVYHVVFKTTTANLQLCPIFTLLLLECGILHSSLVDMAKEWSSWSFCHNTPAPKHHYVSKMILEGLERCDIPATDGDSLTLELLQGVTHRLESSVPAIRLDGMRVARQVAQRMNQDLQFDELDEAEEQAQSSKDIKPSVETILPNPSSENESKKGSRTRQRQLDPDAEYDSEEEEEEENGSSSHGDDNSTIYDDELIPYELEDDEEDLRETPRPLHLLQALGLLRSTEKDEHAYSNHETALQFLPELIESRPDDLPDVAISLLLQVLRMENKFNIDNFLTLRHRTLVALAVAEPSSVGRQLTEEVFKDAALADRLACLGTLQEAAYSLSGMKELEQRTLSGSKRDKAKIVEDASSLKGGQNQIADFGVEAQIERFQSKTRRKRSPRNVPGIVRNQFAHIAPMWFYSLMGAFLKEKENEALWGGSTGSQLLASLLRTLAVIAEFSGIVNAPVLANDLLELACSFLDADVAEVRSAVLISVATSVSVLPEQKIVSVLLNQGEILLRTIAKIAQADPDTNCRHLALKISHSITSILSEMQNPLLA